MTTAMTCLMNVLFAAAPAFAAEKAVVFQYFKDRRSHAGDVRWVGFQAFKEWTGSGVYGGHGTTVYVLLAEAAEAVKCIDLTTPPSVVRDVLARLSFAADECFHTAQLHSLYHMLDAPSTGDFLALGDLPEGTALTEARHELRRTPLGQTVVDLSEGGGLGMYFGLQRHFGANAPRNDLDRAIKEVARRTLEDEVGHLKGRFLSALALGDDPIAWAYVREQLQRICALKLRERNAQFSRPFSEAELEAALADSDAGARYVRRHLSFLLKLEEAA